MLISKDAQCSDRSFCILEFFCVLFLVFETWSILFCPIVVHSRLSRNLKKKIGRGFAPPHLPLVLRPWIPHAFGLRTLASLVSALLITKLIIIQMLWTAQKNTWIQKLRSEHCTPFEMYIIFYLFWSVKTLENCEQSH